MAAEILLALDAGHGIRTSGRRISKEFDPEQHREWWLNDRVARYVQQRAAQYDGFKVLRVDDVTGEQDVKLAERCLRANEAKADFFLSLHHNGGIAGGSGGGLVAYSYPNSAKGAEWRDALYDAVLAAGKLRGNRASPKATANYAVLRQTNMPAVLIEHGFMDSSTDAPVILSESYARACGYAEADCIAQRFGLTQATVPEEPVPQPAAPSDWAKEAAAWAVERGLFAGDGSGDYRWQEPVTREQLAVILYRALQGTE